MGSNVRWNPNRRRPLLLSWWTKILFDDDHQNISQKNHKVYEKKQRTKEEKSKTKRRDTTGRGKIRITSDTTHTNTHTHTQRDAYQWRMCRPQSPWQCGPLHNNVTLTVTFLSKIKDTCTKSKVIFIMSTQPIERKKQMEKFKLKYISLGMVNRRR